MAKKKSSKPKSPKKRKPRETERQKIGRQLGGGATKRERKRGDVGSWWETH